MLSIAKLSSSLGDVRVFDQTEIWYFFLIFEKINIPSLQNEVMGGVVTIQNVSHHC